MKVFNLTDIETPALKRHNLVNKGIVVGAMPIRPGEVVDLDDKIVEEARRNLEYFVTHGALAFENEPLMYALAKARIS